MNHTSDSRASIQKKVWRPEQSEQNTQTKTCCGNPQRRHEQPNNCDTRMHKFSHTACQAINQHQVGGKVEVRESKVAAAAVLVAFSLAWHQVRPPAHLHGSMSVLPPCSCLQVLFPTFLAMRKSPRALRCNEPSQCTSRIPKRGRDVLHMQLADAASLRRPLGFRKKRKL